MIRELTELTPRVNRDFLIRVKKGGDSRTTLVCLTTLGDKIGELEARHLAEKALASNTKNPTFRRKGHTVTFFYR